MKINFDTDVIKNNLKQYRSAKKAELIESRNKKRVEKEEKKYFKEVDKLEKMLVKVGAPFAETRVACNELKTKHLNQSSQIIES